MLVIVTTALITPTPSKIIALDLCSSPSTSIKGGACRGAANSKRIHKRSIPKQSVTHSIAVRARAYLQRTHANVVGIPTRFDLYLFCIP